VAVRVWMLNPYGPIPGEGWRDYRFTLAARALAKRGHDVTWFTASFDHHTKRQRAGESRDADGFRVALVPTPSYAKNISVARLRFERAFARGVRSRATSMPAPDVIIAADPPQSCGAAGRALAKQFGVPLVLDVLDLWPELFVRVAPRALRPFVWLGVQPMFATRRRNMRAASLVVVVADEYRHVATKTTVIPIGVDRSTFLPPHRSAAFSLIYAGTLGEQYDIKTLLAAIGDDIELTIAGQGPALESIRARNLKNVHLAGVVAPEELARLYANASAGVATYSAGSTVALPLKVFDYFAAGLPVITSLDVGGVRYKAGDAPSLRDAILSLRDEHRRAALSNEALERAKQFDSRVLYEQYADAIESVIR